MSIQVRTVLKGWFETGKKPTQSQFADWIDSYWHKSDEAIPQSAVAGLVADINACATDADIASLKAITLNATGGTASQSIPAGTILTKIRVKSTSSITFSLGTSPGGSQILSGESLAGTQVGIYTIDYDCESLNTFHFSGLAGTTTIKFYLLQ